MALNNLTELWASQIPVPSHAQITTSITMIICRYLQLLQQFTRYDMYWVLQGDSEKIWKSFWNICFDYKQDTAPIEHEWTLCITLLKTKDYCWFHKMSHIYQLWFDRVFLFLYSNHLIQIFLHKVLLAISLFPFKLKLEFIKTGVSSFD